MKLYKTLEAELLKLDDFAENGRLKSASAAKVSYNWLTYNCVVWNIGGDKKVMGMDSETREWKFYTYAVGEKQRNSPSDKLFSASDSENLVRESIQNVLDKVQDKSVPAKLKIRFNELSETECYRYFSGLDKHYKACYGKSIPNEATYKFLILEDFNTIGLEGSNYEDFLYRDNIRSGTNETDGGSHGIGKVVLYMASKVKVFFAYSVFKDKNSGLSSVFEGTCDFESHELENNRYKEDGNLKLSPENDAEFVEALFGRKSNETGLSIAIFLPDDSLTIDSLRENIKREYYCPIINEKLTLELGDERIDADWILRNFEKEPKLSLITEYKTSEPGFIIDLPIQTIEKGGNILTEHKEQIALELNKPDNPAVFVRFNFPLGYLDMLIAKRGDNKKERFDFWRGNLLIKHAVAKRQTWRSSSEKYAVILLIQGDHNELNKLLRSFEPPSHTEWSAPKSLKKLVRFVTDLPSSIINQLEEEPSGLDDSFFGDCHPSASAKKNNTTPSYDFEPTPDTVSYQEKRDTDSNGFIVQLSPEGREEKVSRVTIHVAYATNSGSAFNKYSLDDFDLSKGMVNVDGGNVVSGAGNTYSCEIQDADKFKISVDGFDLDRELEIRIKDEK